MAEGENLKTHIINLISLDKKIHEMWKNLRNSRINRMVEYFNKILKTQTRFRDYSKKYLKDRLDYVAKDYEAEFKFILKTKIEKKLKKGIDNEKFSLAYLEAKDELLSKDKDKERKPSLPCVRYADVHYALLSEKYHLSAKYKHGIEKWTKKEENIDFHYSEHTGKYCVVWTNLRNMFFKLIGSKITYLYDSQSLIEDWDKENERFKKFDTKDPNIYLHFALSFHRKKPFSDDVRIALRYFVKNNPDAKGENARKTIRESAWLFPIKFEAFSLLANVYLELDMVKEAGDVYDIAADDLSGGDKFLKGLARLHWNRFKEARKLLNDELQRETKSQEELLQDLLKKPSSSAFFLESFLKERLLDIEGHYFWALGMEKWQNGDKEKAAKCFEEAGKYFKQIKSKNLAELMNYFSENVHNNKEIREVPFHIKPFREKVKEYRPEEIETREKTEITESTRERVGELLQEVRDMKSKIEELNQELIPELRKSQEEEKEKEKLEYAKYWNMESEIEGQIISRRRFNELLKARKDYEIFVIDHGEEEIGGVGEVYFDNKLISPSHEKRKIKDKKKEYLSPLEYKILIYTIKHRGRAGDIVALVKHCWLDPATAESLQATRKEGDMTKFQESTSGYRKVISSLSMLLNSHLGIQLRTFGKHIYRLSKRAKYCLIKVI